MKQTRVLGASVLERSIPHPSGEHWRRRGDPCAPAARPLRDPAISSIRGLIPEPATSSARIITMDHDAIICFMTDRLTRATDTDWHGPSVGSIKVPFSRCRCHILVVEYRWGRMWSNETAITIPGGPRVIDVFDGNGAPSGPNYTLLSAVARLLEASRGRSGSG